LPGNSPHRVRHRPHRPRECLIRAALARGPAPGWRADHACGTVRPASSGDVAHGLRASSVIAAPVAAGLASVVL